MIVKKTTKTSIFVNQIFNMPLTQVITFLFIGIGLSFDSFAVSVSCGLVKKHIRFTQACYVAGVLAFFQGLFPVIGWLIGKSLKNLIANTDHWIAFGLLLAIGLKMVIEGIKPDGSLKKLNPFKPLVLIGLSIATSIDALVVGFSFGLLDAPILFPVVIIGFVTFVAAMLGMLFGKNIPSKRSHRINNYWRGDFDLD